MMDDRRTTDDGQYFGSGEPKRQGMFTFTIEESLSIFHISYLYNILIPKLHHN